MDRLEAELRPQKPHHDEALLAPPIEDGFRAAIDNLKI
jgi:hypothetical protein